MDEILRELDAIQQNAFALKRLAAGIQAKLPKHTEANDRSKSVHVAIGQDWLPVAFKINTDWNDRLSPEAFASAVGEACQNAVAKRMASQVKAFEDAEAAHARGDSPASAPQDLPTALRRKADSIQPRPVDELMEDILKTVDLVDQVMEEPAKLAKGAGANESRKLAITLSQTGQVSCVAHADWIAGQSGSDLTKSLHEALAVARSQFERQSKVARSKDHVRLDQLTLETLAILQDPQRLV